MSEKAAATGRQIQNLEAEINTLDLEINDISSQLASITSIKNMEERVKDLDMVQLDPQQALYLEVPGYVSKETAILAPALSKNKVETPTLLPEFTSSLWDWLRSKISQTNLTSEAQP